MTGDELRLAVAIDLGQAPLSLGRADRAIDFLDRGAVGAVLHLIEEGIGGDLLPFGKIDSLEETRNTGANADLLDRDDTSREIRAFTQIHDFGRGDDHRRSGCSLLSVRGSRYCRSDKQAQCRGNNQNLDSDMASVSLGNGLLLLATFYAFHAA